MGGSSTRTSGWRLPAAWPRTTCPSTKPGRRPLASASPDPKSSLSYPSPPGQPAFTMSNTSKGFCQHQKPLAMLQALKHKAMFHAPNVTAMLQAAQKHVFVCFVCVCVCVCGRARAPHMRACVPGPKCLFPHMRQQRVSRHKWPQVQ
jgi:hypothetical protein